MGGRILVPIDESSPSRHALEYAVEEFPDAEITALYIINLSNYQCGNTHMYYAAELLERLDEVEKTVFETVRQTATEHGREIMTKLKAGLPAETIIKYATMHEIDHIVIGSHGRTGISRLLLGSIAEEVARQSPVPVTIIHLECSLAAGFQRKS